MINDHMAMAAVVGTIAGFMVEMGGGDVRRVEGLVV